MQTEDRATSPDFGEPIRQRGDATCMSGFVPLGTGKIFLTGSRLLWYSNAGIFNIPFSLWRPAVEVPLVEIEEVTSLITGSIRVKSSGGLYAFALTRGSRLNPLFIFNSWRATNSFKTAIVQQLNSVRSTSQ
jgi:hypothetical protein